MAKKDNLLILWQKGREKMAESSNGSESFCTEVAFVTFAHSSLFNANHVILDMCKAV